jgi:hypothetical protein
VFEVTKLLPGFSIAWYRRDRVTATVRRRRRSLPTFSEKEERKRIGEWKKVKTHRRTVALVARQIATPRSASHHCVTSES